MPPEIFGILNVTADSFSDGGRFLAHDRALAQARWLATSGAHVVDVGAAASNPDAAPVGPELEIARLRELVPELISSGIAVSIDSFEPGVQLWALGQGVAWLNDIQGFPDPALYPALAKAQCGLVVMHSVQMRGKAQRVDVPPHAIMSKLFAFFDQRVAALEKAGVARTRLALDPGMGFFLGTDPDTSVEVLRQLPELKRRYGLPLLISVSRKSFVCALAGVSVAESGPATLAAELAAVALGADKLRTHDPKALSLALKVTSKLMR